ncbi:MAG: penicillin-binding protein 2 [Nocardiaceae bacterium]|nr:penicillin-binding protein 2 [Nocardiaceae bacterium]
MALDHSARLRFRAGRFILLFLLIIATVQLMRIQLISASSISAESGRQHTVKQVLPAFRGPIVDRNGKPLAFTMEAKNLTFQPIEVRKQLADAKKMYPDRPDPDEKLKEIANYINAKLGAKAPASDLLDKMRSDKTFVYLAKAIDPTIARDINDKYGNEVGLERQDVRVYPGGALAANLVGSTGWDGHGNIGLESFMDGTLAGVNGSQTYDRGSDGSVIPGSWRDKKDAINGSTVELTIDSDIQYYVQQQVQLAKEKSGAKNVSAVVLDSLTGEVLAMSNSDTFNPAQGIMASRNQQTGNIAVTSPFEPGSVNKIVTAAAAIEYGLTSPDEVIDVDGKIQMYHDVLVKDAWVHGVDKMTTTGIFGKSSNVGTLMLAKRVGEDRFADMLQRFGLGQRTEVGLPGESAGDLAAHDSWTGGAFANLPIGQGLSMTLLQMTSMYQAVANDGVRIPPRIVRATTGTDGARVTTERPEDIPVISAKTASTLRDMFRSVTQADPMGYQQGTAPSAAVEGYQISGKSGTAQQIDLKCSCYSMDNYWITFAGIAPADHPRFVIGMMMDGPKRGADGSDHLTAGPLFHTIASWLLQRENVPLSKDPGKPLVLEADKPRLESTP